MPHGLGNFTSTGLFCLSDGIDFDLFVGKKLGRRVAKKEQGNNSFLIILFGFSLTDL